MSELRRKAYEDLSRRMQREVGSDFNPENDLRDDYSGRGMYGRKCLGYVGLYLPTFVQQLSIVLEAEGRPSDVTELTKLMKRDQMGMSAIAYWPGIQVEQAATENPRTAAAWAMEAYVELGGQGGVLTRHLVADSAYRSCEKDGSLSRSSATIMAEKWIDRENDAIEDSRREAMEDQL